MTKYTERMFYNDLLNEEVIQSTPRYLEKVQKAIKRLDKKNASRSNKPTRVQQQDIEIRAKILEILEEPMTVTQITKVLTPYFPELTLSTSKITAALSAMGEPSKTYPNATGQVKREMVKRTPKYSRA